MPSLGVVLLIKDAGPLRAHLDSGEDQKIFWKGFQEQIQGQVSTEPTHLVML